MLPLPFFGARVLDLCLSEAGAAAARFLADLGAETVLVERAGSPRPAAASFALLQRNKFSCLIDLLSADGAGICRALAARCDFVFAEAGDKDLEEAGLGYESLRELNAGLIYVLLQPSPHREEGIAAAAGAIAALFYRRVTGLGQIVTVKSDDVQAALLAPLLLQYAGLEAAASAAEVAWRPLETKPPLEEVATAEGEVVPLEGVPYRFLDTPAHVRLPAPRRGQHTAAVLADLAGIDATALMRLRERGVVS